MHNCERFGQLQWVRAAKTLKTSNRPHGKMADMPNLTLNFKFGSIYGSTSQLYVPATPANFLSPQWECLADIQFDSHRSIGIQSCSIRDRYVTALPANPHHPHAPWEGLLTRRPCLDSRLCNCEPFCELHRGCVPQRPRKFPITPMGGSRLSCLLFSGQRCLCSGRHSDHLIVHHQRELS